VSRPLLRLGSAAHCAWLQHFQHTRMLSPLLCRAELRGKCVLHATRVLQAITRRFPDNEVITNFCCLTPKMYADADLLADGMRLMHYGITELDGLLDRFGVVGQLEGGVRQPALVNAVKARCEFTVFKAYMQTQLAGEKGILAQDSTEKKKQLTFRWWMAHHGDELQRYSELYKLMLIAMLITMTSVDCERTAGPCSS
jgi:hypothetical protein